MVDNFPRYASGNLSVLWVQHNEHRIVFPQLFFAADLLLFGGHFFLPLIFSFCFYFGTWLVIVHALWSDRAIAFLPRCAAALLAAILQAWVVCAHPLATPFLLQWTLNQLSAILAFAFLAKLSENGRQIWLVATLLSGVVAMYSSANGLLLWAPMLVLAVALHLDRRKISIIAVTGGLSSALYFVDYTPLAPLHWQRLIGHPVYLIEYIATYFSMPFAFLRPEPAFGIQVGLFSLAALAIAAFWAWRTGALTTRTGVILSGYIAFLMCSALMTALGRMNANDPTFQSAKAIRYLTLPLTYWAVLAASLVWILARARVVGTALATAFVIGVSILLFRMSYKPAWAAFSYSMGKNYAEQQWATLAVASGIFDPLTDQILYPDLDTVERSSKLMRAQKICLFSTPEPTWLGRNAKEIFPTQLSSSANGGIVASQNLQTAVAIAGWTAEKSAHLELVFIDENDRIVGLGARLAAGLPPYFASLRTPQDQQWTGFVNLSYGSHTIKPYIISTDAKTLHPLSGELKIDR